MKDVKTQKTPLPVRPFTVLLIRAIGLARTAFGIRGGLDEITVGCAAQMSVTAHHRTQKKISINQKVRD